MVYQQQNSSQQSQRPIVGSHQQTGQHHNNSSQQQQLGQYMGQQHQQMQSNTHHAPSSAATAAYYNSINHIYHGYQQTVNHGQQDQAQSQQQQQTSQQHPNTDYTTHHQLSGSNIPVAGQAPAGAVSGVHSNVHHQQQNSHTSALNHATWSPGVGSINPQTHHPVVTDAYSAMAHLTHYHNSHTNTVGDHHRNSAGPMGSQGLNAGHLASPYSVDTLYNSSSAAAAVAAYGYNNYNAAFFQTSNNGPHSQTGHPTQGPMSTFWNHNQPTQQQQQQQQRQAPISQQPQPSNTNQNSVQQQQSRQTTIVSEQPATNFIHAPSIYYGGQPQPYRIGQNAQTHQTQQTQSELIHHRMAGPPQLHQMFSAHHLTTELHQAASAITGQATPGSIPATHQAPIGQHSHMTSSASSTTTASSANHPSHNPTSTHHSIQQESTLSANDSTTSINEHPQQGVVGGRQTQQPTKPALPSIQKQTINSSENENNKSQQNKTANQSSDSSGLDQKVENVFLSGKDSIKSSGLQPESLVKDQQSNTGKSYAISSSSSSQNVIKSSDTYQAPYHKQQPLKHDSSSNSAAPGNRPIYKGQHQEDRPKILQPNDNNSKTTSNSSGNTAVNKQGAESNYRLNHGAVKSSQSMPPTINPDQASPDQLSSLEDSMNSLALSSPRKTTWASIASQPAKVTQPKSLKSKIAGSTSALSNAKHLAVVSLDSSSSESKNTGINPAIKSSVSAATTSLQRSSMPPPINKLPTVAASLKLDLLGDSIGPGSKISWPAVNASANLESELLREKEAAARAVAAGTSSSTSQQNAMTVDSKRTNNYSEDDYRGQSQRGERGNYDRGDVGDEPNYNDHNHNQGIYGKSKLGNSYGDREDGPSHHHQREPWARRGGPNHDHRGERDHHGYGHHENRFRRDSDRDSVPNEFKEDLREVLNSRKDINNISYRQNVNGPNRPINNNNYQRNIADRDLDEPGYRGNNVGDSRGNYVNKQRPPIMDNRNKPLLRNNNSNGPENYARSPPRFPSQYNNNGNSINRFNNNNIRQPYQQNSFRDSRDRGMDNREHDREQSRENQNSPNSADVDLPTLNPSNYNPKVFELEPANARYFIIKSYSGDDIYRSIKYSIWCSTNHGNQKLDEAFRSQQAKNGSIYLFFSVNSSGRFCGMAQMTSAVDFDSSTGVWAQSKWQGEFSVKWIYVKDVPNNALRHITLENNENKPVTNSRDTQEVPSEKGKSVLKIIHEFQHSASIFDEFQHYERRQEEDRLKRSSGPPAPLNIDHHERPPMDHHHERHHPHSHHNPPHHHNRRLDDDRLANGPPTRSFGGRPYINPRPHNDFQGNHRGGRIGGGPRGPPRGDNPPPHSATASSDKPTFPRENGGSAGAPVRGSGIKLTQ